MFIKYNIKNIILLDTDHDKNNTIDIIVSQNHRCIRFVRGCKCLTLNGRIRRNFYFVHSQILFDVSLIFPDYKKFAPCRIWSRLHHSITPTYFKLPIQNIGPILRPRSVAWMNHSSFSILTSDNWATRTTCSRSRANLSLYSRLWSSLCYSRT